MTGIIVDPQTGEAFARPVSPLSGRELQVLRGTADGLSGAALAKQMWVSEHTVRAHLRRVYQQLGANDRAHAVHLAWGLGLLP